MALNPWQWYYFCELLALVIGSRRALKSAGARDAVSGRVNAPKETLNRPSQPGPGGGFNRGA